MKNFKIIVLLLLSICLTNKIYSQANVSIHFGPAIPVSDFADDNINDEDDGCAAVGINIGLQYLYPLSESGIGIFGGIDFNYNGIQKDAKDNVKDLYESMGINNPDIKYYKYINVPITGGLNYTFQVDDKISLFANAGLAFNFLKITDMEIEVNGATVTTEMDLANNLGLKIGGGILINQKTSISLDYLGLGEHDIDGKIKTSYGDSENLEGKGKVDLLTLTIGFRF